MIDLQSLLLFLTDSFANSGESICQASGLQCSSGCLSIRGRFRMS